MASRPPLKATTLAVVAFLAGGGHPCYGQETGRPINHLNANKRAPSACELALNSCIKVVQAQNDEIKQLKEDQQNLADELIRHNGAMHIPGWLWISIGIIGGIVVGKSLK